MDIDKELVNIDKDPQPLTHIRWMIQQMRQEDIKNSSVEYINGISFAIATLERYVFKDAQVMLSKEFGEELKRIQ